MTGIAVIGTGYWGRNYVRIYKELQSEGMIGAVKICDLDRQRVRELGNTFGIESTTNFKEVINDPRIQAVSIVTPSNTHYHFGKELMNVLIVVLF